MTFGAKAVWAAFAVALVLAGCRREQQFKAPPKAPEPLSFARSTPDAAVSLRLWPAIGELPGLRFKLYQDGVKELTTFLAQAQNDHAHLAAKGLPATPYRRAIDWKVTAATPNLVGAEEMWFDDTGGVHPNHGTKGLIWDVLGDHQIAGTELFRSEVSPALLDKALCDAIKAEKARRLGPQASTGDGSESFCSRWPESEFTLAPSTVKGKIGGLIFLFDPNVLGPYAAGGFEVTVPEKVFHFWLSPTWVSEFAGDPAPPPAAPKR